VKEQILEMAMNGSGIRDTARVLHISPTTVIDPLKKEPEIQVVNYAALSKGPSARLHVVIQKVEEAERVFKNSPQVSAMGDHWGHGTATTLPDRSHGSRMDGARTLYPPGQVARPPGHIPHARNSPWSLVCPA
jgi:hypothetical protein